MEFSNLIVPSTVSPLMNLCPDCFCLLPVINCRVSSWIS
uniref:Uncharacterized protein n=1 Tax=Anguilla anguilla TaxID=7936 RepID=A0A0E9PJS1_ANGAN